MLPSGRASKPVLFSHREVPIRVAEAIPTAAPEPYQDAWDHLHDELKRLAFRLAIHARRYGGQRQDGPLDAFKGLVIAEEEIAGLFRELTGVQPLDVDPRASAWADALAETNARIAARLAATRSHRTLPLGRLATLFHLSPFEQQCLLAAVAPDIDLRFEKVYGFIQNDVTRRAPSIGLMLDLLCAPGQNAVAAREVFDRAAPLFKHSICRLIESSPDGSSLSRAVKVENRITDFLLDRQRPDAQLDGIVRLLEPNEESNGVRVDEALRDRLVEFIGACSQRSPAGPVAIQLIGAPGSCAQALAEAVCRRLGMALLVADLEQLQQSAEGFDEAVARIGREAVLQSSALCVEGADVFAADAARRSRLDTLVERLLAAARVTFFVGSESWRPREAIPAITFVSVEVPIPDVRASKALWNAYLAEETGLAADVHAGELTGRFRFGSAYMHQALVAARQLASWRSPHDPTMTAADISKACRDLTTPKLSTFARKIAPQESWSDLVLPDESLAQLREICTHARFEQRVLGEWGFERKLALGKGLGVLFSGPPGTGKTMAARVLAGELDLDLYQIDLSQVVSKYIGETEKNLRNVFDEADASRAILFFDEADALFGRRSEVRDAHDRYANIEVGYLLQRMEEYESVAILATNMRQNLDEAFIRRLRFIVDFPFPDEAQRRRIWDVTLPHEAPLGEDVNLTVLARDLKLAGGNIRNVALAGAFAAAADGGRITMAHLLAAAQREYQKLGRSWVGQNPGVPS